MSVIPRRARASITDLSLRTTSNATADSTTLTGDLAPGISLNAIALPCVVISPSLTTALLRSQIVTRAVRSSFAPDANSAFVGSCSCTIAKR